MSEENIADAVFDGALEFHKDVMSELHKQYKNTKPFRREKVTDTDLLYAYDHLQPQELMVLTQRHTVPAVMNQWQELRNKVGKRNAT